MEISLHGMVMVFGVLVAIAGLVLLVVRKEQAQNKIKLFGQEFQISTPALVVFLAGCAVFILPLVIPSKDEPVISFSLPWQPNRIVPGKGLVSIRAEEKEPNNEIASANVIEIGATITGSISPDQDRDFFKFKAAGKALSKIRVILRKKPVSSWNAVVAIYDSDESKVKDTVSFGEDTASFAFDAAPNSFYYVMVESYNHIYHGGYELEVREDSPP